jgi:hypothetical protein
MHIVNKGKGCILHCTVTSLSDRSIPINGRSGNVNGCFAKLTVVIRRMDGSKRSWHEATIISSDDGHLLKEWPVFTQTIVKGKSIQIKRSSCCTKKLVYSTSSWAEYLAFGRKMRFGWQIVMWMAFSQRCFKKKNLIRHS